MFRLLSLFAILAAPTATLIYAGRMAFGTERVVQPDNPLYGIFNALPVDAAYVAPMLAVALVAIAYFTLRLIGFAISVLGGAAIIAMVVTVFFKPEWIEAAKQFLPAS